MGTVTLCAPEKLGATWKHPHCLQEPHSPGGCRRGHPGHHPSHPCPRAAAWAPVPIRPPPSLPIRTGCQSQTDSCGTQTGWKRLLAHHALPPHSVQILLCCGACPGNRRMVSSGPGLYPQDAMIVSRRCQMSPRDPNHPHWRTPGLDLV